MISTQQPICEVSSHAPRISSLTSFSSLFLTFSNDLHVLHYVNIYCTVIRKSLAVREGKKLFPRFIIYAVRLISRRFLESLTHHRLLALHTTDDSVKYLSAITST
jgi:hypothetical protein